MPNTYTQLYVQIVFSVKNRKNKISEIHRDNIEKYICGVITNKKSKPIAIYCNPDHTHILIGLHPTICVSDIIRDIKCSSSKYINDNRWILGRFEWQDGFGAFTYSKSQIDNVVDYILKQPEHHRKKSFKEEYIDLLKKFEIKYDDKYLFEFYE
jgi:REP element-mobilizing transposase RayT